MIDQPAVQPVPLVRIARPKISDDEKMILLPLDVRLKAFDQYLTPTVRDQINIEFAAYLGKPHYPIAVGNRLVDLICTTCLADLPLAEARQMLGRCYIERYRQTILGHLLLVVRPLVGLEWVLRGLPRNYSESTNFGTYWVAELEPHHWRFDFEDDPGYPDYILGTFQAGGEILQVPGLIITYSTPAHQHMSFDITWQ